MKSKPLTAICWQVPPNTGKDISLLLKQVELRNTSIVCALICEGAKERRAAVFVDANGQTAPSVPADVKEQKTAVFAESLDEWFNAVCLPLALKDKPLRIIKKSLISSLLETRAKNDFLEISTKNSHLKTRTKNQILSHKEQKLALPAMSLFLLKGNEFFCIRMGGTHTNAFAYAPVHTQAHTQAYMPAQMPAYMQARTPAHAPAHTQAHTLAYRLKRRLHPLDIDCFGQSGRLRKKESILLCNSAFRGEIDDQRLYEALSPHEITSETQAARRLDAIADYDKKNAKDSNAAKAAIYIRSSVSAK